MWSVDYALSEVEERDPKMFMLTAEPDPPVFVSGLTDENTIIRASILGGRVSLLGTIASGIKLTLPDLFITDHGMFISSDKVDDLCLLRFPGLTQLLPSLNLDPKKSFSRPSISFSGRDFEDNPRKIPELFVYLYASFPHPLHGSKGLHYSVCEFALMILVHLKLSFVLYSKD